mmetsp:Transcript_35176/g.85137  ORF Transcript_35176/g.85137 Transcript_35176/m.85137 type:complete len:235 (-) Transcript_35176:552-1256(-)
MRSAMPQLSVKVSSRTPSKNMWQNLDISRKPTRINAALVLLPSPIPSMNPAPNAMTFLRAPQTSAPATSVMWWTRNRGESKSRRVISSAGGPKLLPSVDSQNSPAATSLATFAPIRTPHSKLGPIASAIVWEIKTGSPVSLQKSIPLMRLTPRQDGCATSRMTGRRRGKNWWGRTKIRSVASRAASARSGFATMLFGREMPGRYLTFSWRSLMTSVSFFLPVWPSTISKSTISS